MAGHDEDGIGRTRKEPTPVMWHASKCKKEVDKRLLKDLHNMP